MKNTRLSGILFHPTSLPGKYGIGTLGKQAYKFVDFLVESRQKLWQILPLGPTGYGDSPYQCFSAAAGNPLLIDLETLQEEGLLSDADLHTDFGFDAHSVDYGKVITHKIPVLKKAYEKFKATASSAEQAKFTNFCENNAHWVNDYALFTALKEHYDGKPWHDWTFDIVVREEESLLEFKEKLAESIMFHKFLQFQFFKQWLKLKAYANQNYIQIVGDIPIYVAYDSADTWVNPEIFCFDEKRRPELVAGVPPDYFSRTGQLWGNPIYNWEVLKANGYQWWVERIRANLVLYDIVRIDHFRGLESFWAVPYGEKTAENGKWLEGPGKALLDALFKEFSDIKIIAEDLGVITDKVTDLRNSHDLPGMKILQFAFDSKEDNEYLPHTYEKNCVVYTGTHDNDTVNGWFETVRDEDKKYLYEYLNTNESICWKLIRAAWASVANIAVTPIQDVLELNSSARMNTPGKAAGNWQWRMNENALNSDLAKRLAHLTLIYNR